VALERIDIVTPPAEEPVTLAELKAHAKIDDPADSGALSALNASLNSAIVTARERAETYMRRSLITQTLDVWYSSWDGVGYIELPRGPAQSITSITVYDDANDLTVVDPMIYSFQASDVLFSDWLPYSRSRFGIKVRIVSGYGDADDVPALIKRGILEYATHIFENPAGEMPEIKYEVEAKAGLGSMPAGVVDKWRPFRLSVVL
jgi:uncharacterized phiE125 gp8 family phage protein